MLATEADFIDRFAGCQLGSVPPLAIYSALKRSSTAISHAGIRSHSPRERTST